MMIIVYMETSQTRAFWNRADVAEYLKCVLIISADRNWGMCKTVGHYGERG